MRTQANSTRLDKFFLFRDALSRCEMKNNGLQKKQERSLESWIWDAACSIRGAKDAPKYKDYILPLIFTKRLCDVFDDELDRVVANPMWNQDWFTEADYDADELERFPAGVGFPGKSSADWGWVQHMHASQIFEKGDPKNFIPEDGIQRIADTLIGWKEEEKLSLIVDLAELKKNDYNISPSRYIHTGDDETYRPIGEIVAELDAIEAEAKETDKALREIPEKIGI